VNTPWSVLNRSLPSEGADATLYASGTPPSFVATTPTIVPVESARSPTARRRAPADATVARARSTGSHGRL
jgi:hypothetical protein